MVPSVMAITGTARVAFLTKESAMREDERARWTKLLADFESVDQGRCEFAPAL